MAANHLFASVLSSCWNCHCNYVNNLGINERIDEAQTASKVIK